MDELIKCTITIAQDAGALILKLRKAGLSVTEKVDKSILTSADTASEQFITAHLRRAAPDIPIISEEGPSGQSGKAPARFWLVDPLDGTREFAKGLDEFTVNIALVTEDRSKLGVVAAPGTHEVYAACLGWGAWKTANGETYRIHARPRPAIGAIALISRHDSDDPAVKPLLRSQAVDRVIKMGSGLKFCRIAEGKADFYPRPGRTMEWDTAAPQVILEAAGGSVETMDGQSLRYGKPGWVNPPFVCRGARPGGGT